MKENCNDEIKKKKQKKKLPISEDGKERYITSKKKADWSLSRTIS
jgi:hypothetical protein